MKNKIAIFILSLVAVSASAQIHVGFTIGPNFSNQKWVSNHQKFETATKTRLQYHLGAIADFPLSTNVSIQPEMLFSYNGSEMNSDVPLNLQYSKFNLGYLKMPIWPEQVTSP